MVTIQINIVKAIGALSSISKFKRQPLLVLLYTLLYIALFGLVIQPMPRGALNPRLWRIIRFTDMRAAMRLLSDGVRNPNFIRIVKVFILIKLIK